MDTNEINNKMLINKVHRGILLWKMNVYTKIVPYKYKFGTVASWIKYIKVDFKVKDVFFKNYVIAFHFTKYKNKILKIRYIYIYSEHI